MRQVKYKTIKGKRTFAAHQWQHKAEPFVSALSGAGWERATIPDVYLFDHDLNRHDPSLGRENLNFVASRGCMVVLYPHSVLPEWWYGASYYPSPNVKFRFQIAEAQETAWKMMYPELPIEICGWPYSDIKPFKRCPNPEKILFAPIHHPLNGSLRTEAMESNKTILRNLEKLKGKYSIRVRYLGELRKQGLYNMSGIEFKRGMPDGSTEDIEWADIVVAEQTFMFISTALGKPVIGINQDICPRPNYDKEIQTDCWKAWWHLVRYPISHTDGNLEDLILQAGNYNPVKWKRENIGSKMEPEKVVSAIERHLEEFRKRKRR